MRIGDDVMCKVDGTILYDYYERNNDSNVAMV